MSLFGFVALGFALVGLVAGLLLMAAGILMMGPFAVVLLPVGWFGFRRGKRWYQANRHLYPW